MIKNTIMKAEHDEINQANDGNYLNELMIKIESKPIYAIGFIKNKIKHETKFHELEF